MRTIWNGSISFGLVNIPVGLALATTPKAKQSDVSFRTLHRECKTPIRQKRWCPTHEREVGPDEIVKGWEVAKGEFVIVEDADLEAISQHDDSRSIDITRFVPLDEVDPVYLDRTYYLAPAQAAAQLRPYVLLLEAMKQAEMGAIGRFVLRGAEYFALIRPKGDALVLETLFLAEDVRSQAEIDEAVAGTEVKKAELDLAQQVMQSLVGEFDPCRAAEPVPQRPAPAARSEARRPGDRQARARGGSTGGRPARSAQAQRAGGEGPQAGGCELKEESRCEERLSSPACAGA